MSLRIHLNTTYHDASLWRNDKGGWLASHLSDDDGSLCDRFDHTVTPLEG